MTKEIVIICLIIGIGFNSMAQLYEQNNNVGIGISTPQKKLHVSGTNEIETIIETTNDGWAHLTLKSNNKKFQWSKRPAAEGDILALYYHDGSGWANPPYISINPNGNSVFRPKTQHSSLRLQSGYNGTGSVILEFSDKYDLLNSSTGYIGITNHTDWAAPINSFCWVSTRNGTSTTKDIMIWAHDAPSASNVALTIKANTGNIGIGTANPQAKLAVNGDIFSKKVKVTLSGWPDYVFHPTYSLRPLSDLEKYIREHGHLPEVPSAEEVEENGLDLGDTQAVLLKKIEELTLYVIEQEKKIKQLEAQLNNRQKEK